MSWRDIKVLYKAMAAVREDQAVFEEKWAAFAQAVRDSESDPPYHMRLLWRELDAFRGDRERREIHILDHGCGGGLPVLMLIALGYENAVGVNTNPKGLVWNEPLARLFGDDKQRIFAYDGLRLPFEDDSYDFIYSQQVIEHVAPDVYETYYSEEGRIAKDGARALHQVPHRGVPFDSHTNTWFIHWLPRQAQFPLYTLLRKNTENVREYLHLRSRKRHLNMMQRHFGPTRDLTVYRLKEKPDLSYYDGNKSLRKLMWTAVTMPVLGSLFTSILINAVMLESVSDRQSA